MVTVTRNPLETPHEPQKTDLGRIHNSISLLCFYLYLSFSFISMAPLMYLFFFYFPTLLRSIDKGHIFSSIMYLKQNFTKDQLDLDELDPCILELWWQIIVTVKFGLRYKPSTWHLGYRHPSWSVVWLAKVTTKRIIEQDEIVEFVWIGKWTKLMTCCKHTYAHRWLPFLFMTSTPAFPLVSPMSRN